MRIYTIILVWVLSFTTALSLGWFMLGLPGADTILTCKDLALGLSIVLALAYRVSKPDAPGVKLNRLDLLIAILIVVNLLSFYTSPATLDRKVINLRRDLSLFLFLWAFYYIGRFRSCCSTLRRSSFACFGFIAVFGVFEYLSPDALWNEVIRIPTYWQVVAVDPFGFDQIGASGRFYSWDLLNIVGSEVRRMVSFYAEPTTLAAFFVFVFCISYLHFGTWFRVGVFFIGLLTVSKFFVLSIVLIVLVRRFVDKLPRHFMLICFGVCTLLSVALVAADMQSGAMAHLSGLVDLFTLIQQNKFLGFGLGAAGNYAGWEADAGSIGSESGIGNVAAQLGLGILAYLWFFNQLFNRIRDSWCKTRDPQYMVCLLLLSSWIVAFFMSASSLGLSGNAFFFIYIGSVLARESLPDAQNSLSNTANSIPSKKRRPLQKLSLAKAFV